MLGPIDIEDWSDDGDALRARLRQTQEFFALKTNPDLIALNTLDESEFALLSRFCADDILSDAEIDALVEALRL
jgi:hypothetical protein